MALLSLPQKPTYVPFPYTGDFYGLFQKIHDKNEACFLLESLGDESALSRYSILGFSPERIIRGSGSALSGDVAPSKTGTPYDALRAVTPQNILSRAYCGGLVGYLGYDSVNYFEPSLATKNDDRFPTFIFGAYTDGLVHDTMTGEIFYFFYTENRLRFMKRLTASAPKKTRLRIKALGDTLTKYEHKRTVEAVKEEIKVGNTFQCQIGFKSEYEIMGSPLLIYERLRKVNPSPYMFYLKFGDVALLGASPELLFRLRDREIETFPLAGTAPRGKTAGEDIKLARALLNDPKEIAEHNMLVDLHRNDMGRVAEFGTVFVRRLMDIKKFSHVQHISSEIAGIMRRGEDMFSGLSANFPAGTLSGAPKCESMKIINQLEPAPRGPYGGAVGHFGFNGDCTFTIPIRSFFVSGLYAYTQNSSGIVYDSSAEREYEEVKRKGEALQKVLSAFL